MGAALHTQLDTQLCTCLTWHPPAALGTFLLAEQPMLPKTLRHTQFCRLPPPTPDAALSSVPCTARA